MDQFFNKRKSKKGQKRKRHVQNHAVISSDEELKIIPESSESDVQLSTLARESDEDSDFELKKRECKPHKKYVAEVSFSISDTYANLMARKEGNKSKTRRREETRYWGNEADDFDDIYAAEDEDEMEKDFFSSALYSNRTNSNNSSHSRNEEKKQLTLFDLKKTLCLKSFEEVYNEIEQLNRILEMVSKSSRNGSMVFTPVLMCDQISLSKLLEESRNFAYTSKDIGASIAQLEQRLDENASPVLEASSKATTTNNTIIRQFNAALYSKLYLLDNMFVSLEVLEKYPVGRTVNAMRKYDVLFQELKAFIKQLIGKWRRIANEATENRARQHLYGPIQVHRVGSHPLRESFDRHKKKSKANKLPDSTFTTTTSGRKDISSRKTLKSKETPVFFKNSVKNRKNTSIIGLLSPM